MRVTLLGPPGVGKGTLAARLSSRWGVAHLSTGELLRAAMRDGADSELADAARVILSGAFVPDEVANRLVLGRLKDQSGFILDGFPRTVPQAETLDSYLLQERAALDAALLLDAPDELIDARIRQRRVCVRCGWTCDLRLSPPAMSGKCDRCEGAVAPRPEEDEPEKAALRRALYRDRTGAGDRFLSPDEAARCRGCDGDAGDRGAVRLRGAPACGIIVDCVSLVFKRRRSQRI